MGTVFVGLGNVRLVFQRNLLESKPKMTGDVTACSVTWLGHIFNNKKDIGLEKVCVSKQGSSILLASFRSLKYYLFLLFDHCSIYLPAQS